MATVEEVLAKADAWEKAGKPENAAKLRAYAETLKPAAPKYDAATVEAKAAEWEKAGDTEKAAKLRGFAATLPKAEGPKVDPIKEGPVAVAPGAGQAQTEDQMRASRFAQFEEANPILKGRFTAEDFPSVGDVVTGPGGGGKSGGARYTVQGYGAGKPDAMLDTAAAMVEGPMAAFGAFKGGLTGGESPSRDYLANDPLTRSLPGPVLTGLGAVGDLGGAGLSLVGAGISGATGLASELMPGQNAADELALAEDLTGMAMFAVPELAGASSVPARMAASAPKAAPAVGATPKAVAAAPKVAEVAARTPEEVGTLTKKAASGGMGAIKAQEELAAQARVNPEAKAAADRLGIDLPADVFFDDEMVKATVGLTRSEVGKEPEALWRRAVKGARDKADEIMAAMDGSPDLASVSEAVKGALQTTQARLKNTAKSLYSAVDDAVPKSTEADVSNIVKTLNGVIEELGGIKGMTAQEKALFDLVTNPDQPVTYGRLLREKSLIGKAIERGDSPYSSMDMATLKRLYGAMADDQLSTVASLGDETLRAKLREANQITAKQKAFEKRIVAAYGSDLDGSIGAKLKSAVTTAAKGDIAGLNRILKVIPEDLRKSAVASAITAATRSARATEPGFGLAEFGKLFGGVLDNKPVLNLISKNIGAEAVSMLKDLHTVARRISSADVNVLRTGKANQALVGALTADGLISRALSSTAGQRATQAAAIGIGSAAGGPMVGMVAGPMATALLKGTPDMLAKTGKLFASEEFQRLAIEAADGAVKPATVEALKSSPAFKRWARSLALPDIDAVKRLLEPVAVPGAAQPANAPTQPQLRAIP